MKTLRQKHNILVRIIGEAETKRLLHNWYDRAIRRAKKRKKLPAGENATEFCRNVLNDLQNRTGLEYRLTKATKSSILARKADGFSLEDFLHVHEKKCLDWLDDGKMRDYLHPSTLYRPKNFEKYKIQWEMWQRDLEQKKVKAKRKKEKEKLHELVENDDEYDAERGKEIVSRFLAKLTSKNKEINEKISKGK